MQNPPQFPSVKDIEEALKKAREPEYFYDSALFPPPPPFPQMPARPFRQVQPYPQITFKVKTLVYRQLLSQNFPDTPPAPTYIWVPPPNIINNLRNVTVWVEFVGRSLKDEEEFTLYGSEARVDSQKRFATSLINGYTDGFSFFNLPSVNAYPDLLFTYQLTSNKYVYTNINNNTNGNLKVVIGNTYFTVLPGTSFQNNSVLKNGEQVHLTSFDPLDLLQGQINGSIIATTEPTPTPSPQYTPIATPTPTSSPKPTNTPTPTPSPSQVHVCMPSVVLTEVKGEPPIYTFNNICGPKGLGIGTYTFLNVPAQYAIGFLNTEDIKVSGTYSLGTHLGPQGGVYEFFFDTVTLVVKKNFGVMSYFSYPSKQYLGGYNSMIFDPECIITPTRTPSATWRPVPLPTKL